jgi:hypothetical protein
MPVEAIRDRRPPFEITDPLLPVEAERLFLSRFNELTARNSHPLPIQPVAGSPSPFGEIGAIIATVNATLRAHGGATGGGTQSRPAPVVGCRGLQRSERTRHSVPGGFGGNCLTHLRLIELACTSGCRCCNRRHHCNHRQTTANFLQLGR